MNASKCVRGNTAVSRLLRCTCTFSAPGGDGYLDVPLSEIECTAGGVAAILLLWSRMVSVLLLILVYVASI